MSKLDTSGIFSSAKLDGLQTRLTLPAQSYRICKNGIEFRSHASLQPWTEMTVSLGLGGQRQQIDCTGVVVACHGNRHTGFVVSIVLMNLSPQSQARLEQLAQF